jgi:hypothetical protein
MHRIAKAILIAAFLLAPAPASASLTVNPGLTVSNQCNRDIIIAVYYKDSRGFWATTSFTSIPARKQKERVASLALGNPTFYYYAESTTGSHIRWTGNREVKVEGESYSMKETRLNLDRDRNRYLLELTCSN